MFRASYRMLPHWIHLQKSWTAVGSLKVESSVSMVQQPLCNTPTTGLRKLHTRWRYPADESTRQSIERRNVYIFCFTLNTDRPVCPQVMERALLHLYKKVDFLQLCMKEREGIQWVADMENPIINFQVLENRNYYEAMRDVGDKVYDVAKGPLWGASLLQGLPEMKYTSPTVKAAYPNQCHLIIDVNHGISDGISFFTAFSVFLKILDDLLDGRQIDDKPINAVLCDSSPVRSLKAKIKGDLLNDTQRLKELLDERSKLMDRIPLLTEAFGDPNEPSPITYIHDGERLDETNVTAFMLKCKEHKITLNSGFTALINSSLVEMARDAGLLRDSYTICSCHAVDSRRYLDQESLQTMILGDHALIQTNVMTTPWDVSKCLWRYAKKLDAEFRRSFSNFGPLEESVLDKLLHREAPLFNDYLLTNIISTQRISFGVGKHVQATLSTAYSQRTLLKVGAFFSLSKVGGVPMLHLTNSTSYMTKENAVELLRRVVNAFNIKAMAE